VEKYYVHRFYNLFGLCVICLGPIMADVERLVLLMVSLGVLIVGSDTRSTSLFWPI